MKLHLLISIFMLQYDVYVSCVKHTPSIIVEELDIFFCDQINGSTNLIVSQIISLNNYLE